MKYLLLLVGDGELTPWDQQTAEEQAAAMRQLEAFDRACTARDGVTILAGEALGGHPTSIRTRGGEVTLTDGPYAEAVEGLGGFYLIEAPDLDALLEVVRVLPPYDMQVSPVVDPY